MKLSKKDIHTKHTLPSGWYSFTITQGYMLDETDDPIMVLCHTVDTGTLAYQHVLLRVNLIKHYGQSRLKKMCDAIEFNWFVDDVYHKLFPIQFTGLRGEMKVEQVFDDRKKIIYNKIIEWRIVEGDPQYNVMKDKDEKVFEESEQKGKPKLPV